MPITQPRGIQSVTIELTPEDTIVDKHGSKTSSNRSRVVELPDLLTDITTKLRRLEFHHTEQRLLFRVVCKETWGSALLNEDILPGNTAIRPLEDPNFDWRSWLKNHGKRNGGISVATSFTVDFLRAITIAL
jgi:hypothetical protein